MKVAGRVLAITSFHSEALFTSLPGKRTRRKTRRSEKHCVFECVGQKSGDRDVCCYPLAVPFIRAVATDEYYAPVPIWSVSSIFVSPPFLRGASLFEHLFPVDGCATRVLRVYVYAFAIAPDRAEVVSSMQKGVDQQTQGDSLKLVYLKIGDWKLHELFQSLKVFHEFFLSLKWEVLIILMNVVVWKKI